MLTNADLGMKWTQRPYFLCIVFAVGGM